MNDKYDEFSKLGIDKIPIPSYLEKPDKVRFSDAITRLEEMHKLITNSVAIAKTARLPLKLVEGLDILIEEFKDLVKHLTLAINPAKGYTAIIAAIDRVHNDHANFFEPSSSNKRMMTINAISNYRDSFDVAYLQNLEGLNAVLEDKNKRVDQILARLENPSAEQVLADYAAEYEKEEIKTNKKSNNWLIAGVITTISF